MKLRHLLLWLLLSAVMALQAAGFRPIITNFTPTDYGFSTGSQVWSCSQDSNGTVYFATTTGLLVFDGYRW